LTFLISGITIKDTLNKSKEDGVSLSTLTSKGQITIPKGLRESMKIVTGDKVEFIINEKNEVVIKPITKKAIDVFGQLSTFGLCYQSKYRLFFNN
jgi:AbrB family looped-hinge helix DNA binding protein